MLLKMSLKNILDISEKCQSIVFCVSRNAFSLVRFYLLYITLKMKNSKPIVIQVDVDIATRINISDDGPDRR